MPAFPLMWTEDQLGPPSEDGCPVTHVAIECYLEACSYHYLCELEPPLAFGPLTLALRRWVDGRDFWIFSCIDGVQRPWFVAASGGEDEPKRWVFAQSVEDDLSAEALLDYAVADWRSGKRSRK